MATLDIIWQDATPGDGSAEECYVCGEVKPILIMVTGQLCVTQVCTDCLKSAINDAENPHSDPN